MTRARSLRAGLAAVTAAAVSAALAVTLAPAAPAEPAGPAGGVLDEEWGDDDTDEDEKASRATGTWDASKDRGSLYSVSRSTGVHSAWFRTDQQGRPVTGRGVTVALIDTGVTPVPGLDGPGKVVNGPDLSFESQHSGTRHLDGYGHGTHMAGIIAGRDSSVREGQVGDLFFSTGVAPDARLLNVKVGAADGGTDVTQVIAALDWVVAHRNDNGMNVRVVNLSYGTDSLQPYQVDPLARAVENAWRAGIVVVVAAGNDGAGRPLTMPAADPYVIAVGASDHRGTESLSDDRVTDFTNPGTSRRYDLLAPGKSVVSLRVPGSSVDLEHPEGLVTGDRQQRFFRGSGTSQAAAVVSGAVALLLQARPSLTPDQVKKLLVTSAHRLPTRAPSGHPGGLFLDVRRALDLAAPSVSSSRQAWPASTGTGSLEASRGGSNVVDPITGTTLTGETDALGAPWDGRRWTAASAAGTAWSGGTWNGRRWTGDAWTSTGWSSGAWSGTSWTGGDWQGRRWTSGEWTGRRWTGGDWSGRRWTGSDWEGRRWTSVSAFG